MESGLMAPGEFVLGYNLRKIATLTIILLMAVCVWGCKKPKPPVYELKDECPNVIQLEYPSSRGADRPYLISSKNRDILVYTKMALCFDNEQMDLTDQDQDKILRIVADVFEDKTDEELFGDKEIDGLYPEERFRYIRIKILQLIQNEFPDKSIIDFYLYQFLPESQYTRLCEVYRNECSNRDDINIAVGEEPQKFELLEPGYVLTADMRICTDYTWKDHFFEDRFFALNSRLRVFFKTISKDEIYPAYQFDKPYLQTDGFKRDIKDSVYRLIVEEFPEWEVSNIMFYNCRIANENSTDGTVNE